jgi:peptide/nickel transport system permease protein
MTMAVEMVDLSVPSALDTSERSGLSRTQRVVRWTGFGILGALILCAFFAPWIAPYAPDEVDLFATLSGPSRDHLLGTDNLGRDVLSRLIYGARTSLFAAALAVLLAAGIGVIPGMVAGYYRGAAEAIVMRIADTIMAFPSLILAIAIVGVLGPSLTNAMIAVGILIAPRFLRLMRGVTMTVRDQAFIEASRLAGQSNLRILFTHVLPNTLSPLTTQLAFTAGVAILAESSLSFVGLGAQAPTASWGSMVSSAVPFMETTPLLIIAPGVVIALAVLSFNIVGDAIRDSWGREV